jgi:cell division protein FtsN
MRIVDYSGPKKSCNTPQSSQNYSRKESSSEGSGSIFIVAFISGFVCLCIGFGSGWMLSQRSAKKTFRAAMEQQSLENTPQPSKTAPLPLQQQPVPPVAPLTATTQQQTPPQQPTAGAAQPPVDPPLSFYNTLPRGQKSNVMGSGINNKEDKPAKQPLQAAMPTNIAKPPAQQNDEIPQKNAVQPTQQAKTVARSDTASGLTVQVASYSLKSEAETLRAKLASKGYNVNISESHQGDKGVWYRVRVGKKLDPESAKELAAKLGKGAVPIPDKD